MAETLRELVVALSLDSSNFSRNMRTINAQIKEAESTFRLAGAGVENFEKTIAGTEAKLSMLGNKLTQQNRAVEQYSLALVAANDKLKENYNRHQDYSQRLDEAKARQEALRFEVETATFAYEQYRDSLGETDSATIAAKQKMERYQEEYQDTTAEVTKLEGQVKALQKTMQNSADTVSKATTDLNNAKAGVRETEAEIRRLTEQLYRMQSAWTQAGEALTAIGKKCETISKAMTKAGKTLTRNITTPILGLGTAAVKASIALLAMSAVALADGNSQGGIPGGMPPQGQMGGPNGENQPDGQMPNGQTPSGEKPSGAPELPSGEKPADLPELPSGEKPADLPEPLPELPNGEKPADAPELSNGEKPVMIDFDSMVTKGAISQETCDKIKAYMEEHKPAGMPEMNGQTPNGEKPEGLPEMNGEQPAEGQTPPELPDGEKPEDMPGMNGQAPEVPTMNGLLKELLDAEVITQAEYDALSAFQAADAT